MILFDCGIGIPWRAVALVKEAANVPKTRWRLAGGASHRLLNQKSICRCGAADGLPRFCRQNWPSPTVFDLLSELNR